MIRRLTEHWELKLVALVIAIALWLYTNGQVRVEKSIIVQVVPEAVELPPGHYRVTAIQPQGFTVQVSVPMSAMAKLKSQVVPKLVISAEALATGAQIFPINSRVLGFDDDVRIEHIDPDTVREIRVVFNAITEDYLPVEPPRLSGLPEGLESNVVLDRTRVRVRGTREQLDAFKAQGSKVTFEPVALDSIDPKAAQERKEALKLAVRDGQLDVAEAVMATITITPVSSTRQVVSVPVQVLAPREFFASFRVELSQPQVAITVRGPTNLLKELHSDELIAYVVLRRSAEPNVAQEAMVNLVAPAWMTYDPVAIRITVAPLQPRPAPEPPPVGAAP